MSPELQEALRVAIFNGNRQSKLREKRIAATQQALAQFEFEQYVIEIISRFEE